MTKSNTNTEHISNLIEKVGNESRYQAIVVIFQFLLWMTTQFFDYALSFLEDTNRIKIIDPSSSEVKGAIPYSYEHCSLKENTDYTIASKSLHSMVVSMDLQCDSLKVSMIGTMISVGYVIGAFIYQYVLRLLGQKKSLLIMNIVFIVLQFGTIFIQNYYYVVIVMFLNSVIAYMFQDIGMVQIQEISSLKKVSIYAGIASSGYCVGGIVFSLTFMGLKKWEYISYINCGLGVVTCILIFFFCLDNFNEMVAQGNLQKFKKSLRLIATINGKLTEYEKIIHTKEGKDILRELFGEKFEDVEGHKGEQLKEGKNGENNVDDINNKIKGMEIALSNVDEKAAASSETIIDKSNEKKHKHKQTNKNDNKNNEEPNEVKSSFLDLFRYASVRYIFLVMCVIFVLVNIIYYGLTIGVKNLPGNIYINDTLLNCVEIPTHFLAGWMMQVKCLGRKISLIIFTALISAATLILFIFYDYDTLSIVVYLATRAFSNAAYVILITYGYELYPKSIAQLAYGINGVFFGVGGIIVSFVGEYVKTKTLYLIFFIIAAANALLLIYPPETFNKPAPDQIKELEANQEKNKKKVDEENGGNNENNNNQA